MARRPRRGVSGVACLSWLLLGLVQPALGAQAPGAALQCDLGAYRARPDATATLDGDAVVVEWAGAGAEALRLRLGLRDGAPVIAALALRPGRTADWRVVAADMGFELRVVEGLRRISNQQLAPLRALGVEITQDIVDRYKWDVFWDAPLDLRREVGGGNPPPARGSPVSRVCHARRTRYAARRRCTR